MRIVCCIKQVPDTASVEIDEVTGALKRESVESKVNVYDLYALEMAIRIRNQVGGSVMAVSMGPEQAKQAVREALMLGADEGCLISDRRFAGADVLATSHTLAEAVRVLGFDLIVCGKQTTDGDTAQVGPALAEQLNIPHVAWVSKLLTIDQDALVVEQDLADCVQMVRVPYPCLITVEKGDLMLRLPSYKRKQALKAQLIRVLSMADFADQNAAHYGAEGSATRVEKIFPPDESTDRVMLEGTPDALAKRLCQVLAERKFI